MKNKTISILAAAAISIGVGFAATSSATAAPAMGEMQASAYADTDLLAQAGGPGRFPMPLYKRNYYGKQQKPNVQLTPKVCYERQRVGPKQYVLVRRAC